MLLPHPPDERVTRKTLTGRSAAASASQITNHISRFTFPALLLLTQTAFAAAAERAITPVQPPSIVFSLLRLTGAMALVVGCFLGGVWLYRNWQRFAFKNGKAPRLNVLESRSLGPRHGIYVVGYDRQRFLIASAPGGISMLSTLPEATPEELRCEQPAPHPLFTTALAAALKQSRGKARAASAANPSGSNKHPSKPEEPACAPNRSNSLPDTRAVPA